MSFEGAITRLLQFIVLSFFTFAVFFWYGGTTLLLLAFWIHLSEIVGAVLGMFISLPLTLVLIVLFCFYIMRTTRFFEVFYDVGRSLFVMGARSVGRISRHQGA